MPIVIKDYTPTDEETKLFIKVTIPNIHPSKVDIYSNSCYLKINAPPFFWELDLFDEIVSDKSVATVGEGKVTFQLLKKNVGFWKQIDYQGNDRFERRKRAQDEYLQEQEKVLDLLI